MNEGALRDFLIDAGMLTRAQVDRIVREAEGKSLEVAILEQGVLSEDEVRRAMAHALGVPYVVLDQDDIEYNALELIPEPLARTRGIVAYRIRDNGIEVALLNINDLSALEYLRPKFEIRPRFTSRDSMKRALLLYQKRLKNMFGDALVQHMHAIIEPAPGASEELLRYTAERLPVAQATDILLRHALHQHATHVHLIPHDNGLVVRYRVADAMHDAMLLPRHAAMPILLRLKLLSGLALKYTDPQEGRFKIKGSGVSAAAAEQYAIRVSTLPTANGEKMVLRIVRDHLSRAFTLESLGFHGAALESVHAALLRRRGCVAVVGPERAGKTTTLYTMLDIVHSPHLSLSTIEENIEARLPYASQTTADPAIGLTTAVAMRAALKLDPDVLMVGDVSDTETASLVSSAAARGVLVLAGTEKAELLTSTDLTIHVRTVKKLCHHHTHEKVKLSRIESNLLEERGVDFAVVRAALIEEGVVEKDVQWKDIRFPLPEPCARCDGGYHGLLGIQGIEEQGERRLCLAEDALFKAVQGLTTLDEVLRVTEK